MSSHPSQSANTALDIVPCGGTGNMHGGCNTPFPRRNMAKPLCLRCEKLQDIVDHKSPEFKRVMEVSVVLSSTFIVRLIDVHRAASSMPNVRCIWRSYQQPMRDVQAAWYVRQLRIFDRL